ncbi:unnamed protein product, partial [Discosporangium mesarthrocarpum]
IPISPSQLSTRHVPPLSMSAVENAHTMDGRVIEGPLQPVANNILVKIAGVSSMSKGGIVLPDQASRQQPTEAVVVAAGEGRTHPMSGVLVPMCVEVGDTVLFSKYAGRKLKYDGEDHMFIMDDDLLLVCRGEEVS